MEAPPTPKPPVSADPILWKELYAEPLVRFGPGGQSLGMILGIMGLLTAGYVLLLGLAAAASTGHVSSFASILARFGGNALACMMLLGVALRAAGTLTTERDRQTLDGLLTTALDNKTILFGKLLGSILSVRKGWWLLGPIWVFAVLTGGIHPLALPLLLLAWVVYASFVASLGVFFSLICRSTLASTFITVLTILGVSGGHRGLWLLFQEMWNPSRMPERYEWIGAFLQYAFTPPLTFGVLTFRTIEFESRQYVLLTWQMLAYGLVGIVCFAALAGLLWGMLLKSFGPVTGRMPLPRSKRDHEPAASPVRNG